MGIKLGGVQHGDKWKFGVPLNLLSSVVFIITDRQRAIEILPRHGKTNI